MSPYREPPTEMPKRFRYKNVSLLLSEIKYVVLDSDDSVEKFPYRVKFLDGETLRLGAEAAKALLEVLID